jgi:hypothetical protein
MAAAWAFVSHAYFMELLMTVHLFQRLAWILAL